MRIERKKIYNALFWAFVVLTCFTYVWTFFSIVFLVFWDLL